MCEIGYGVNLSYYYSLTGSGIAVSFVDIGDLE